MIGDEHRITKGYVARHIPPKSRLGVDVAILDIAQDFLLAHLAERGVFELVTFKGGTALRKLFAGAAGRFSTDIDLAPVEPSADRDALAAIVARECGVTLGPFAFSVTNNRGRWQISVMSDFGNPGLTMKLDVGAPCWLAPQSRAFVPTATQERYGFFLSKLPCMRLEEILAEKIARLTHKATARDASDLVWVARTSPHSQFDRARTRRLAMLKVWVDNNGMGPAWKPTLACAPFSSDRWLAPRAIWDDDQIGLLASPPPSLRDLESGLRASYAWIAELSADEARWGRAQPQDRGEVLAAVRALSDTTLRDMLLY